MTAVTDDLAWLDEPDEPKAPRFSPAAPTTIAFMVSTADGIGVVDRDTPGAREHFELTNGEGSWQREWDAQDEKDTQTAITPRETATRVLTSSTWREVLQMQIPPTEFRIEGILPKVGLSAIVASAKTGKSAFALQSAISIARGLPVLGRPTIPCTILYMEEEGTLSDLKSRALRQGAALGALSDDLPIHFAIRQSVRVDTTEGLEEIRQKVTETGAEHLFIGPLTQIADVEENDTTSMARAIHPLAKLAHELRIGLTVIHHCRKPTIGTAPPTTVQAFWDTVRGSTVLVGAIEGGIGLLRSQEDEHGKLYVIQREARAFIGHYAWSFETMTIALSDPPEKAKTTPETDVLRVIDRDGPANITQITVMVGGSASTVDRRLEALIKDGYVTETPGPRNSRLFSITDAGSELLTTAQ